MVKNVLSVGRFGQVFHRSPWSISLGDREVKVIICQTRSSPQVSVTLSAVVGGIHRKNIVWHTGLFKHSQGVGGISQNLPWKWVRLVKIVFAIILDWSNLLQKWAGSVGCSYDQ